MINTKAIGIHEIEKYKYEYITKDIENLEKRDYEAVYGKLHTDVQNEIKYGFCIVPLIPFLDELEINQQLTMQFHLFGYSLYSDVPIFLDGYGCNKIDETINTYNYESNNERILQYTTFEMDGIDYIALQVHCGIDAREGYTDVYFFEYTGDIDYMNFMIDSYTLYINDTIRFDIEANEYLIDADGWEMNQNLCDFLEKLYDVSTRTYIKIELYPFEY